MNELSDNACWQFETPSERQRFNGETTLTLTLKGETSEEIMLLFKEACNDLGWEIGPKVGDGTPDAALAIGEHAFRAGYQACEGKSPWGNVDSAWDNYDPLEDIKADHNGRA